MTSDPTKTVPMHRKGPSEAVTAPKVTLEEVPEGTSDAPGMIPVVLPKVSDLGSRKAPWVISGAIGLPLLLQTMIVSWENREDYPALMASLLISFLAFYFVCNLIPHFAPMNMAAGLFGRDINKVDKPKVAEAGGMISATVFLLGCAVLTSFDPLGSDHGLGNVLYLAGLCSIMFMVFLGFADDVLNLKWRHKLIVPLFGSLPLIFAYEGSTTVMLPPSLVFLFPTLLPSTLDLGLVFYGYMLALAIFCTNAINIYAGVNGLEVGQSVVIGFSIIAHNLMQISRGQEPNSQIFSLSIMTLFLAVCVPLFVFNWFPSRVFVGDTFTYFSGMSFAVCGVLGHFGKTLLLLMIPQIFNFLYSLPQLFRIVPCPRHRMPRLNAATGKVEDSGNMTLICLVLRVFGPMNEGTLCAVLLALQVACAGLAFTIRYVISSIIYE